jgi:hypothetical protein
MVDCQEKSKKGLKNEELRNQNDETMDECRISKLKTTAKWVWGLNGK